MIVGLEFDRRDDLVAVRLFVGAPGGHAWMREPLRRGHERSLYEVAPTRRVQPAADDVTLAIHAMRHGRLLADRQGA